MIITEVLNELTRAMEDPARATAAGEHACKVMNCFLRPKRKLPLEFLSRDYDELPPNEGTFVMPCHASELMWFVMHCARQHNNQAMVRRAAEAVR
jgi:mannose/cellobiose epimerase-like protein (N-acyl-D-glucosamine 2-epimerase family)